MWPLLICSILAITIIVERFIVLQQNRVSPPDLITKIWQWLRFNQVDKNRIRELQANSPLGRILAAGLANRDASRDVTRESIEDVGRHVTVQLERNLTPLGTIAAISPLLGLLGTVVGMIKVFAVITTEGVGNPEVLADGISQALLTTAAGLLVAIPTIIFYRFFRGKISTLVVDMEEQAIKLIDILHSGHIYDPEIEDEEDDTE